MKTSFASWTMAMAATGALVACGDDTAGAGGAGTGAGGDGATTTTTVGPGSTSGSTASTTVGSTSSTGGDGGAGTGGAGGDATSQGGAGTGGDATGQGGAGTGGASQGGGGNAGEGGAGGGPEVPPGWTCNPGFFAAQDGCDCACGAPDLDCDIPSQEIIGCDDDPFAPYCGLDGTCTALPPWWECEPSALDDGAICDCACGGPDPDCELDGAPILGCAADEACGTSSGLCVPPEWTCSVAYYGATDGCDCSCGAPDPDCEDPDAEVFGCEEGQACSAEATCEGDVAGCDAPTAVGIDGTFAGDTSLGDGLPTNSCASFSTPGLTQVFTFTPAQGGEYAITVVPAGGSDADLTLAVRGDCNVASSELDDTVGSSCGDDTGAGGEETIVLGLAGGTAVAIVVTGYGDDSDGAFTGEVVGPIF